MATVPAPPASAVTDLSAVTRAHLKIRDARAQLAQEFKQRDEELKGQQAKLEGFMLNHLNQHGMESVRTDAGTFYKTTKVIPNIVDDTSFFQWIKDNDAFEAMERRVKKGFIVDFMKTHEDALPPGISVHREYEVVVRRPS